MFIKVPEEIPGFFIYLRKKEVIWYNKGSEKSEEILARYLILFKAAGYAVILDFFGIGGGNFNNRVYLFAGILGGGDGGCSFGNSGNNFLE